MNFLQLRMAFLAGNLAVAAIAASSPASAAIKPCDQTQISVVKSALTRAKQGMTLAIQSIDHGQPTDIASYTEWFGAGSSSTSASVRATLAASSAFSGFQLYYCPIANDPDISWDVGDVAQVRGQGEEITAIYLSPLFFEIAPSDETKQYGVIVHELTHFRLTGNTVDVAYGKQKSRQLAKDDPASARKNASNYHFFVQSFFGD